MAKLSIPYRYTSLEDLLATGEVPPESLEFTGRGWNCLASRLEKANYRLAEAHLIAEETDADFFPRIRTLISRGFLDEAERLLAEQGRATVHDPEAFGHIQIEIARIRYQNGDWLSAAQNASEALRDPALPGLSRLTVYQIRAAAWFEAGEFARAAADIESVRTLQPLYPKAQSAFYNEVLAVKVAARQSGVECGEALFSALQNQFLGPRGSPNPDTLLTLIRLKTDLHRISDRPIAALALAGYRIAEAMGDQLYARLALLDLEWCESPALRKEASTLLELSKEEFRRVEKIRRECESGSIASESARTILAHAPAEVRLRRSLHDPVHTLVLAESAWQLTLPTLELRRLPLQRRSKEVLLAVDNAVEIGKAELFEKIWRLRFVSVRHDPVLRNTFARIRKQCAVHLRSNDQRLSLEAAIILGI